MVDGQWNWCAESFVSVFPVAKTLGNQAEIPFFQQRWNLHIMIIMVLLVCSWPFHKDDSRSEYAELSVSWESMDGSIKRIASPNGLHMLQRESKNRKTWLSRIFQHHDHYKNCWRTSRRFSVRMVSFIFLRSWIVIMVDSFLNRERQYEERIIYRYFSCCYKTLQTLRLYSAFRPGKPV